MIVRAGSAIGDLGGFLHLGIWGGSNRNSLGALSQLKGGLSQLRERFIATQRKE